MFLFLMNVDWSSIVVIAILLVVCGQLIFWLTKKLLRKVIKDTSDGKSRYFSIISAIVLSPIIVIGSLALFVYITIQTTPKESDEEIVKHHYEMMEDDLKADLKAGMSKTDVVKLFGEADTTQSVLVYDLSLQDAKEKYMLEITFDTKGLKDFKRQQ